jgi:hypothetical protein
MLSAWGSCGGVMCLEDMDINDAVDAVDVLKLIEKWGTT